MSSDLPQREFPVMNNFFERNLSFSERDDYRLNVAPLVKRGHIAVPIGEHRNGTFVIFGWKILLNGGNRW